MAAGTRFSNLFIEAEPGSGKTAVASLRFGALRYRPEPDDRGVLAVSFTRAATADLSRRVRRAWGPSATDWPHRIGTIDFLMRRLVRALCVGGHIEWVDRGVEIEVVDDWRSVTSTAWTTLEPRVGLQGKEVLVVSVSVARSRHPEVVEVQRHVSAGTCTHEDIRTVLADSLEIPDLAEVVKHHLASTVRAIIVDEVFDANKLDLAIFELAMEAGVELTIIGDPWQALYGFRGARPQDVPLMVARTGIHSLPLTASFRWKTNEQRDLAVALRDGKPANLPGGDVADASVALAGKWNTLWEIDDRVLPIAFGPAGDNEEARAAMTLMLNQVTRNAFQLDAADLGEALKVLGISHLDPRRDLEPHLNPVVQRLSSSDSPDEIHRALSEALDLAARRPLRNPMVSADRLRIEALQDRLMGAEALVPGMTIHQAKGREWDYVAVCLDRRERETLARGLSHEWEADRKTYVACTRARMRTFAV